MSNHDQLAQQAERMRNTFNDYLDQPNHAQASHIMREINELISDLKAKKSRDAIDRRLRNIMDKARQIDEEVMDVHHSSAIAGLCDQLRGQTRTL